MSRSQDKNMLMLCEKTNKMVSLQSSRAVSSFRKQDWLTGRRLVSCTKLTSVFISVMGESGEWGGEWGIMPRLDSRATGYQLDITKYVLKNEGSEIAFCPSLDVPGIWASLWIHAPLEAWWVSGQVLLSVASSPSSGQCNLSRESTHSCQDPFLSCDSLPSLLPAMWCSGIITMDYGVEANTIEGTIRQGNVWIFKDLSEAEIPTGLRKVISRFALCKKKYITSISHGWASVKIFTCLAAFDVFALWRCELWSLQVT